jgi:hypothetical protein
MRVLECGSGPGYFIAKMLTEFPALHATGVEIDPFLVARSKEELAKFGPDRHRVLEGSILAIPFENDTFDFVMARLVLEHLPDPVAAAREMRRVLKPGGKVVVRDIDLEIVVSHNRLVGDHAFLRSEGSGIPAQLVKEGFLSRDVLDRLADRWHKALQQPDHCLIRQLYVAAGSKTGQEDGSEQPPLAGGHTTNSGKRDLNAATSANATPMAGRTTGEVEKLLSRIWSDVLGVPHVGLDDNFFDIGGDSVYLVDVVTVAQTHGFDFTPVIVFEHPTIRGLAKHLTGRNGDESAMDRLRERAERQRQALGLKPRTPKGDA